MFQLNQLRCAHGTALSLGYQSMTKGKAYQVCNVAQAELFHHIRAVRLDRFDAQRQLICNFLVGVSFSNQSEHLDFTRGQ